MLKKISIRPFLGPKVGIPIGKMKIEYDDSDNDGEYKMKGVTIGMDFGCGIDFNKVKAQFEYENKEDSSIQKEDVDVLRRGALGINITADYRF